MMQVPIRSRSGNMVLVTVGAIYVLAALAALVWVLRDALAVSLLLDKALLLLLAGAAAGGLWFLLVGLTNLGVHLGGLRRRAH